MVAVVVASACATGSENAACSAELDQEQHEVASRAVDELNDEAGVVASAVTGPFSEQDRRDVRRAAERIRKTPQS